MYEIFYADHFLNHHIM